MCHPWLFSHAPSSMSTSSSSPIYPSTHREHSVHPAHLQASQSTSCAIKNHSGVKTCRVAEIRAPQLPQVMSPKNLRLSQGSKLILEIHINHMMYRKSWRRRSPSSYLRRSGEIWRDWDGTAGLPDSKISEKSHFARVGNDSKRVQVPCAQ